MGHFTGRRGGCAHRPGRGEPTAEWSTVTPRQLRRRGPRRHRGLRSTRKTPTMTAGAPAPPQIHTARGGRGRRREKPRSGNRGARGLKNGISALPQKTWLGVSPGAGAKARAWPQGGQHGGATRAWHCRVTGLRHGPEPPRDRAETRYAVFSVFSRLPRAL